MYTFIYIKDSISIKLLLNQMYYKKIRKLECYLNYLIVNIIKFYSHALFFFVFFLNDLSPFYDVTKPRKNFLTTKKREKYAIERWKKNNKNRKKREKV